MPPPSSEFFFDALALILAAIVAGVMSRSPVARMPWSWLAASFFGFGVHAFLAVRASDPSPTMAIECVRLGAVVLASLAMLEFGRRAVQLPARWIHLPLLALAALGALGARLAALEATCRYGLAMPAGLLAAAAFWRAAQCSADGARGLRLAALALVAWAAAIGLSVPPARFVPAAEINRESFLALTGFSVQHVLSLCALATMTGLWWNRCGSRAPAARRWLFPAAALMLVVLGWAVAGAWERNASATFSADLAAVSDFSSAQAPTSLADYKGRSGLGVVLVIFVAWGCLLGVCALVNRSLAARPRRGRGGARHACRG